MVSNFVKVGLGVGALVLVAPMILGKKENPLSSGGGSGFNIFGLGGSTLESGAVGTTTTTTTNQQNSNDINSILSQLNKTSSVEQTRTSSGGSSSRKNITLVSGEQATATSSGEIIHDANFSNASGGSSFVSPSDQNNPSNFQFSDGTSGFVSPVQKSTSLRTSPQLKFNRFGGLF